MPKSKIEKHHPLEKSFFKRLMFFVMQNMRAHSRFIILNGENVFFKKQIFEYLIFKLMQKLHFLLDSFEI